MRQHGMSLGLFPSSREDNAVPDHKWTFWKNEAKLAVFDPEQRVRFWITILGGLIVVVLLYAFGQKIGIDDLTSRTLAGSVLIILFPFLFAVELFYKGNKAGNRLKSEVDELQKTSSDRASRVTVTKAIIEAKQNINNELAAAKRNRPGEGKASELKDKLREFDVRVKEKLILFIKQFDEQAACIPCLPVGAEEIEQAPGFHEVCAAAQQKLETIEGLEKLLYDSAQK